VILPWVVRIGLKILQRKCVPSLTLTVDGLPGDPVILALIGEFRAVHHQGQPKPWHSLRLGRRPLMVWIATFVEDAAYQSTA
jgi:hypothetical protein